MMKRLFIVFILGCLLGHVKAGDGDYAVSKIPASLLKDANAVKRFEEIRFEVIHKGKARYFKKFAYTILNEKGDEFAACYENYDKLQSVESIEGRLFDENGKRIKALKKPISRIEAAVATITWLMITGSNTTVSIIRYTRTP